MDIELHYRITGPVTMSAGFNSNETPTIAHASQYHVLSRIPGSTVHGCVAAPFTYS